MILMNYLDEYGLFLDARCILSKEKYSANVFFDESISSFAVICSDRCTHRYVLKDLDIRFTIQIEIDLAFSLVLRYYGYITLVPPLALAFPLIVLLIF